MHNKRFLLSFVITTILYCLMMSLLDYSETRTSYWLMLQKNALPSLVFGVFVTVLNWLMNRYFERKE